MNDDSWHFPLRSPDTVLDTSTLVRQLRLRPVRVVLRAIEPVIVDVCQPFETFESAIQSAQRLYIRFAVVTLALSRDIDRLKAPLRSFGALDQVAAHEASLPVLIQPNLAILHRIMTEDAAVRAGLEFGQLPCEGVFLDSWRLIMEQYGHRGEDETDLSAPRYAEQPEKWIQAVLSPEAPERAFIFPHRTLRGVITRPVWRLALRYGYAREHFRHSTMYAFAHLRNELLRLADRAAAQGKIEGRNDIWAMTVSEVIALDTGTPEGN